MKKKLVYLSIFFFTFLGVHPALAWRDLETGTYLTRDPAGFVDGPNLYAYVKQNPWTYYDPLGLQKEEKVLKAPSNRFEARLLENNLRKHIKDVHNPLEAERVEKNNRLNNRSIGQKIGDGVGSLISSRIDDRLENSANHIAYLQQRLAHYYGNNDDQGNLIGSQTFAARNIENMGRGYSTTVPFGPLDLIPIGTGAKIMSQVVARNGMKLGKYAPKSFLGADDFAKLKGKGTIDPSRIRFSQDSIAPNFKPPYGSVDDLAAGLRNGSINSSSIKPVRIVQKDGQIFGLDNRRLKAFQDAGVGVPFQKLDHIPKREMFKFTTDNAGTSIRVR